MRTRVLILLALNVLAAAGVTPVALGADSQPTSRKSIIDLRDILTTISESHNIGLFLNFATTFQIRAIAPEDPTWNPASPRWAEMTILVRRDLERDVGATFAASVRQNDEQLDNALAARLSGNQVDELLAFYRSAVGQRYVEFQKQLSDMGAEAGAAMLTRMMTGGNGSKALAEPTSEVMAARLRLLAYSWQDVTSTAATAGTGSAPDDSSTVALKMTDRFIALSRGQDIDNLQQRYAADLPLFEGFHRSAAVHALVAASRQAGKVHTNPGQNSQELAGAVDHSAAVHLSAWRAAYEAARNSTAL